MVINVAMGNHLHCQKHKYFPNMGAFKFSISIFLFENGTNIQTSANKRWRACVSSCCEDNPLGFLLDAAGTGERE